jgi:hypothetical protein
MPLGVDERICYTRCLKKKKKKKNWVMGCELAGSCEYEMIIRVP